MSLKKKPQKDSHKRVKIVEIKRKIIEKQERGVSVADLACTYNRSTSTIWKTVASYIEKHHRNKAMAMHATNLFNNAVLHFHQILKRRQKQMSLDSFLVKMN
ncbi:hypothetical protein B7P43_G15949 [Cryptotermes secundus]|uniref:HTH psq-type domain-containing protein n=1 Tax=Cryptotermes secundus TaxID=105785 RepID=A0A2J7RGL7_9NEOP|nr:hypothetical protein B7P43_G15949 [Cryptotermes secundus]